MAARRSSAYMHVMAMLPRPSGPLTALRDLGGFLREQGRGGWKLLLLSCVCTAALIAMVIGQFSVKKAYKAPVVTYVPDWRADRSRAEIAAQQARDKPAQDAKLKAERDAALERQRHFQRVADMMGLDYKK